MDPDRFPHPRWDELPVIEGRPNTRLVNGTAMTREDYEVWDWRVLGTYVTDDGKSVQAWGVTYAGIEAANRRTRERKVAARVRREADDEYSNQLIADMEAGR